MSCIAYTDYPMFHLDDKSGELAPIREVEVISYDGDKYCVVRVKEDGSIFNLKSGYLYNEPVRLGEGTQFNRHSVVVDEFWWKTKQVISG